MTNQIAPQHPAVVLRSHYMHLRALLAVAMFAIVGLTVAVVILAVSDGGGSRLSSAAPVSAPAAAGPGVRYDGGPEEGTSAIQASSPASPPAGTRYDGGPEEGTSGVHALSPASPPAGVRYDGGPEEGTTGPGR